MPKKDELRRSGRERKLKHENMDINTIINSPHFDYLMSEAQRRLAFGDPSERRASRRLARHPDFDDDADDDASNQAPSSSTAVTTTRRSRHSPRVRGDSEIGLMETDHEEEIHIEKRITRKHRFTNNSLASSLDASAAAAADDDSRDAVFPEAGGRRASLRSRKALPDDAKIGDEPGEDEGEDEEEEESSGEESGPTDGRRYSLREHRTAVDRYAVDLPDPKPKPAAGRRDRTPPRSHSRNRRNKVAFLSPAHRRHVRRRMTSGRTHDRRSSSTSSDGSGDDDDARFERRKVKSLERAREKFLPSNLDPRDARSGAVKDRMRAVGASCTDVDPMEIDRSVKFDQVGGLAHHIQALKEMVIFPMVYPEVFAKFKLAPPRGVVFYGPPGTGKTLVARALSNECSKGDKKVSFFMRKGADCLSKWVGESERQLRLLFDQAYTMRPSIIFFDELDGIAPVRSSRQDQIHSSIVSTLLALMDGLDARGEVVVIGATNRLDALDPALRRPGRFDRELRFSLPDRGARREILRINTKEWDPPMAEAVLDQLSERTVGYCGADLKGICTEAALVSLRHRYPQIYMSEEKLVLDVESIRVEMPDFDVALRNLTPASRRGFDIQTKPISGCLQPLLGPVFDDIVEARVPPGYLPDPMAVGVNIKAQANSEGYARILASLQRKKAVQSGRLIISAPSGEYGQTSHLAPAIMHAMDHLQVHSLAIPNIYAESSSRSAEEAVAGILKAASRSGSTGPTLVFLPAVEEWRRVVPPSVWHTLTAALDSWDALTSVLLLVTAHDALDNLDPEIRAIFRRSEGLQLGLPSEAQRRSFFSQLLILEATRDPVKAADHEYPVLEIVPRATEEDKLRKLSEEETKVLRRVEEGTLRELRSFLRDVLNRLIRDRRFAIFAKPVDLEEAPDYYEVIETPMDLGKMMEKIDLHCYRTVEEFLADADLITANALEYNPDVELHPAKNKAVPKNKTAAALKDKSIRHRACALRDAAYAIFEQDLEPEFERRLKEVVESMERRGVAAPAPPAFITANSRHTRSKGPAAHLNLDDVFAAAGPRRLSSTPKAPANGASPPKDAITSPQGQANLSSVSASSSQSSLATGGAAVKRRIESDEEESAAEDSEEAARKRKRHARRNPFCLPKRRRPSHSSPSAENNRKVLSRHSNAILKKYKTKRLGGGAVNVQPRKLTSSGSNEETSQDPETPAEEVEAPEPVLEVKTPELPEPHELLIDEAQLNKVLNVAVAKTAEWPMVPLQRLYATLSSEVEEYATRWDRSELPSRLAGIIAGAERY